MGIVTFNHISSDVHHIQVETPPDYETAERDYNVQHILGRNGDIVQDTGSYKNVPRSFKVAIGSYEEEYSVMANRISKWLHSGSGYLRLEDSYEPDYYRLAMYMESGSLSNLYGHAGRTTINFNCKPQRFLKSGEVETTFYTLGKILNPSDQVALPIITVVGDGPGVLTIGSYTITMSQITNKVTINCEIEDAYDGTLNQNSYIIVANKLFPKLQLGETDISFSGGITSVRIMPRWWTL